jgi:hypothetical protein
MHKRIRSAISLSPEKEKGWQMSTIRQDIPAEKGETERKDIRMFVTYNRYAKSGGDSKMKFDIVVGNPPYQNESIGGSTSNAPIYNYFYDMAEQMAPKYCLISPARFLSRAARQYLDYFVFVHFFLPKFRFLHKSPPMLTSRTPKNDNSSVNKNHHREIKS